MYVSGGTKVVMSMVMFVVDEMIVKYWCVLYGLIPKTNVTMG
jgi:hypothetical protein